MIASCERLTPPAPAAGTSEPQAAAPPGDPLAVAGQRDVSFRASGIEPGWYVEVTGGERPPRLEPGSGARADYTVVVQVAAQTLRGCGRGR
jgi:uncharacterized membrane protein